jgi:PadR family transcriptional regulator PadR
LKHGLISRFGRRVFPVATPQEKCHTPVAIPQGPNRFRESQTMPAKSKSEILQGTLDLMVLKTLAAMGSLHGYGIARRIEQISEEALQINQGTIYASLVRLLHKGWISAEWGTSENNRKARFYSITKSGRKQLHAETQNWRRIADVIGRVLRIDERS